METTVKFACKSLMLSLMLAVTALMPSSLKAQSQPEPSIIISISNFDEQLADINYLLKASGFPEMKFIVGAAIKGYTKGIDGGKNAGVMLYFEEESPQPSFLAFVPVSDIDDMLDVVAGMAEVDEEDDMYVVIAPGGEEVMIKEKDGYAFIAIDEEMFRDLPADPAKALGDLPKQYNLAAKMMPQRVPASLKDKIIEAIEEGSRQTLDNLGDDLQSDLQRKNLAMQMNNMEMVLDETEEVTIGMCIDADTKALFTDFIFKATKGSKLAAKMAASKATAPTRFSGFLMDGAAMTMNSNTRMDSEEATTYSGMLEDLKGTIAEEINQESDLSEAETDKLIKAAEEMIDVVKKTLKEGVFDVGGVVMLKEKEMNFAGGMQIADPLQIEKTVKDLVPMLRKKADGKLQINLDSGTYKGVNFHEILVMIPEGEDEAREIFGDKITVLLGIGKKAVYVAGGTNPMDLLKKGMDETHPATEAQQINIYLTPIMQAASQMGTPPEVGMMAEKLIEVGKDRMSMVTSQIENGMKVRMEMQDGILALIKVGVESFQNGGIPDDDF